MKKRKSPLARNQGALKNHTSTKNYITESPPFLGGALPDLSADLQLASYSQKLADSTFSAIDVAAMHKLIADLSLSFDGNQLHRLRVALEQTAKFLGWEGETG